MDVQLFCVRPIRIKISEAFMKVKTFNALDKHVVDDKVMSRQAGAS